LRRAAEVAARRSFKQSERVLTLGAAFRLPQPVSQFGASLTGSPDFLTVKASTSLRASASPPKLRVGNQAVQAGQEVGNISRRSTALLMVRLPRFDFVALGIVYTSVLKLVINCNRLDQNVVEA